jgi:hypothetical protein
MINGQILFDLPEPLSEPKVIKNFFPDNIFERVKVAVNSLGIGPDGHSQYHPSIGRWESWITFDEDIESFCLQQARDLFNDQTLLKSYFFVARYQIVNGNIPLLWEHYDGNGTQTTIDVAIENTAKWNLNIEGTEFQHSKNDAIIYAGQQHLHSRPPYPTDDESLYCTAIFMHFTQPDHWFQKDKSIHAQYYADAHYRFFNKKRYFPIPDIPLNQQLCSCHDFSSITDKYSLIYKKTDEVDEPIDTSIISKIIHAPGIIEYAIKPESASILRGLIQNSSINLWEHAQVKHADSPSSVDYSTRNCYTRFLGARFTECHSNDPSLRVLNALEKISNYVVSDISAQYGIGELQGNSWQLLRYEKGVGFRNHVDDHQTYPRVLSLSVILNDDYSGGEFIFEHFGIEIEPKPGSIIAFNSGFPYMHRVNPIVHGIRYSAVKWFNHIGQSTKGV